MLDLVKPEEDNKIRLKDLKRCKLTNVFFDTFFNLEKYLSNEQKDPFSNLKVGDCFTHLPHLRDVPGPRGAGTVGLGEVRRNGV